MPKMSPVGVPDEPAETGSLLFIAMRLYSAIVAIPSLVIIGGVVYCQTAQTIFQQTRFPSALVLPGGLPTFHPA